MTIYKVHWRKINGKVSRNSFLLSFFLLGAGTFQGWGALPQLWEGLPWSSIFMIPRKKFPFLGALNKPSESHLLQVSLY